VKKVLAINGSVRAQSSNGQLINYIRMKVEERFELEVYNDLASLPHFSPDIDNDTPPASVADLRARLSAADGIFICTPEYAHGVPGTLKNAIDWTVSSMELYNKPVSLVTASSSGQYGHAALIEILSAVGAITSTGSQLLIPFIKTKLDNNGAVKDPFTIQQIDEWINSFVLLLQTDRQDKK